MINIQTEQLRIQALINQDKLDSQTNDQSYQQSLSFIRDHLQLFVQRYAKDNRISVSEVSQRITRWDKQQWLRAIKQLDTKTWPDEAKQRLSVLALDAGINVQHMITAIVGVGVLAYFVRQHALIKQRIETDGISEVARSGIKSNKKLISIVTDPENVTRWSSELWSDSDQFQRDLESVVSKHLRHGTSVDELVGVLVPHSKALEKPGTNAADRLAVAKRNAQRLIVSESARVKSRVNIATMRMQDVTMVDLVNEPGACDKCVALAEAGPYPIEQVPLIPDDTHPNCRCGYAAHSIQLS